MITEQDKILADRLFPAHPNFIVGHRKPKNKEMPDWMVSENKILSDLRKPIEDAKGFGALKLQFHVLSKIYRHKKKYFNNIFKSCMVLRNIHCFPELTMMKVFFIKIDINHSFNLQSARFLI